MKLLKILFYILAGVILLALAVGLIMILTYAGYQISTL